MKQMLFARPEPDKTPEGAFWEIHGIRGKGESPPPCAGNHSGPAVVMATGWTIWDDLERFDPEARKCSVVAVNNMILHWKKRVHHGVSLHAEEPPLWRFLRGQYGCDANHTHTHAYRPSRDPRIPNCDYLWPITGSALAGTSTLFAVAVALALGYSRIIVAGAPLDGKRHFYDPPSRECKQFASTSVRQEWQNAQTYIFQDRVRALSGWTRELLGEPTDSWITNG